jgi:small subunit ribosomal protein S1
MDLETFTNQETTNQNPPTQSLTSSDPIATGMDEYLENGYDYQAPKRGDIRTGVVIDSNDQGLVVDIGFKREGFVPAEDLTRLDEETRSEVNIGSEVSVFVLRPENRDGHPILSIHQASLYKDWVLAEQMMGNGDLYEGEIAGYNRGGLIVKFGKIRGFIPASQIVGLPKRMREEQRRQRMETMIGKQVGLKIIEVDRQRRRLIFSQRRALRVWQETQRERVMSELVAGETRRGKVTSITNFGAFVDLGGADGLIHVSELSWKRVDNPRQVLAVGDEIDVYVLEVDRNRKRIALSLKKLQPDPWTIVDDHYQVGQLVEGDVTRVLDFGAFVELEIGIEGLLHASEMIGTPELAPSDIVHSGEKLLVKIIRIDGQRKRLALSAKQVRKGEWEQWVAEQQAAHETREVEAETEVSEVVEETEKVPEAQVVAEEEATVPEAQVMASEVAKEEAKEPEAQVVVSEAVEETDKVPEAQVVAEEVTTVPEAQVTAGEAAEEEAKEPEAQVVFSEATAEEDSVAAIEAEVSSVIEEEAKAPEAAVSDAAEEQVEAEDKTTTFEVAEGSVSHEQAVAVAALAEDSMPDVTFGETEAAF